MVWNQSKKVEFVRNKSGGRYPLFVLRLKKAESETLEIGKTGKLAAIKYRKVGFRLEPRSCEALSSV